MMLDPETRRHTVGAQRKEYRDLRAAVDEFLSAVNVNDPEGEGRKKDIGRLGEMGEPWYVGGVDVGHDVMHDWGHDCAGGWGKGEDREALNQINKGLGKKGGGKVTAGGPACFECGEVGHWKWECPKKGNGKGA